MKIPTIIDLSTGRVPAVIVTGHENIGSSKNVFGICSPDVSEDEIRAACGRSEITMSGYATVTRSSTGLGVHVQRFTVSAYTGD